MQAMWIAIGIVGFVVGLVLLYVASIFIGGWFTYRGMRRQTEATEQIADWYVEARAAGK